MWNRAEDQVTFVLIRHGKTPANEERRYLGRTDEGLSQDGRESLVSGRDRGRYPDVGLLFVSPMKRCVESARLLYPGLSPVVIPEWAEMDFGLFEYKNASELGDDPRYQAWIDSGGVLAFPGGESREAFILRCRRGMMRMCGEIGRRAGERGASALSRRERPFAVGAVVHGGTVMALLSSYGGRPYFDSRAENGGGYVCRLEGFDMAAPAGQGQIRLEVMADI